MKQGDQSSLITSQTKNVAQNLGPLDELQPVIASIPNNTSNNQNQSNTPRTGTVKSAPPVPSLDATNYDNFYTGFALAQANVIEALT